MVGWLLSSGGYSFRATRHVCIMSELLKAENICKTYQLPHSTVNVLSGASLSVSAGQTVAVIGVSGAGKSTLMHLLGGLDRPDEGSVSIDGADMFEMTERERSRIRSERIGFVFQSYHLLPEMDVCENVMLPAIARRRNGVGDIRSRALQLLDSVGLKDRSTHTPMELSGGEQQRVALARALMNDPDIVLADEPTGNLDGVTGGQVLEKLFALVRERNHALVLVTHNREIAASCDSVLELRDGKLV
jgi:lipoprotein-releasing system ATP-binding protein